MNANECRIRSLLATVAAFAGFVAPAWSQQDVASQIWANVTYGKKHSQKLYFQAAVDGKKQTSGDQTWRSLSLTPAVEYYPNRLVDVIGELLVQDTRQTDGVDSYEVTPRIGLKFHFLKQALGTYASENHQSIGPLDELAHRSLERASLGRWDFACLLRVEARNIWYSTGDDSYDYSTRARGRLEYKLALNRRSLAEANMLYLLTDLEYFVPFGDDVLERFPSKTRFRGGLGYRFGNHHRVEAVFVRDFTRDAPNGQDTLGAQALAVNWKMKF